MSFFLAPMLAAAAAAAALIPIGIHLYFRLRRPVVRWSAMRWVDAALARVSWRKRSEPWLLLALRSLLAGMVALAAAGPLLPAALDLPLTRPATRSLHLVLDPALDSRYAIDPAGEGGQTRLERLRAAALAALAAASPGDRVSVWSTLSPGEPIAGPVESGDPSARLAVESLEAGWRRGSVREVMASIAQRGVRGLEGSPGEGEDASGRGPRPVVVLLSGWGVSSLLPDDAAAVGFDAESGSGLPPLDGSLRRWASGVTWQVTTPAPRVASAVVTDLSTDRDLIVASGGLSRLAEASVTTRRLPSGAAAGAKSVSLRVEPGGRELELEGESIAVDLSASAREATGGGGRVGTLTLTAALSGGGAGTPFEMARTRDVAALDQLRAWISPPASGEGGVSTWPGPADWLELALSPGGEGGMIGVRVGPLGSASWVVREAGSGSEVNWDGIYVLDPGRVDGAEARRLAEAARGGAVVHLIDGRVEAGPWSEPVLRELLPGWRVGSAVERLEEPASLTWSGSPPGPLSRLAADWRDLLTPVRVSAARSIEPGPGASVWLGLGPGDRRGSAAWGSGPAWLAVEPLGAGAVVVMASPLSVEATSLPTQPAFVSLMRESLLALRERAVSSVRLSTAVGSRPRLGEAWDSVRGVVHAETGERIATARREGVLTLASPVETPGLWLGERLGGRLGGSVDSSTGEGSSAGASETRFRVTPAGLDAMGWTLSRSDVASAWGGPVGWFWVDPWSAEAGAGSGVSWSAPRRWPSRCRWST